MKAALSTLEAGVIARIKSLVKCSWCYVVLLAPSGAVAAADKAVSLPSSPEFFVARAVFCRQPGTGGEAGWVRLLFCLLLCVPFDDG